LKSELREVANDASARAARRVGDELEWKLCCSNPGNRLERARQGGAANIHDAVKVEQDASDDAGVSFDF
jgi:hypothetical protein